MYSIEYDLMALRGNSVASKAIEIYQKLVGETFLSRTLADIIKELIESPDDLEVDPSKFLHLVRKLISF